MKFTDGIKNTLSNENGSDIICERQPRAIYMDQYIKDYSKFDAWAILCLKNVKNGKFASDSFVQACNPNND